MRCSRMPKRSHQTARRDSPNNAQGAAKGVPLSVRIAAGRPKSLKVRSKTEKAKRGLGRFEAFAGEQVAGAVIGDGERVAVLPVTEQELALVVRAPEAVGRVSRGQRRAARLVAPALSPFDEPVAIECRVDRAHRRRRDHRVLTDQLVADLRCAPGRELFLDPEDRPLDLERQLVGLAVRGLAAVVESIEAACLVAVEDFVAGHPGDAELAAHRRHLLAFQQAGYEAEAFIHRLTLFPGHLGALPQMRKCVNHVLGIRCKLSVDKLIADRGEAAGVRA
jgi:hypothetical protein